MRTGQTERKLEGAAANLGQPSSCRPQQAKLQLSDGSFYFATIEVIEAAPDFARRALERWHYPKQRRARPWHVAEIKNYIATNRFRQLTTIDVVAPGDEVYQIANGQHALEAMAGSDGAVRTYLIIITHHVATIEQAQAIYATFDRHLSRTVMESLVGYGVTDRSALTPPQIENAIAATKWIANDFRPPSVNVDPVIARDLIHVWGLIETEWGEAAQLYYQTISAARRPLSGKLRTIPVMAVALPTLREYWEEGRRYGDVTGKAVPFWKGVADDNLLANDDPRKALIDALTRTPGPHTPGRIVSAWNAWWDNEKLITLREAFAGMIGITIKGTPLRARRPLHSGPALPSGSPLVGRRPRGRPRKDAPSPGPQ